MGVLTDFFAATAEELDRVPLDWGPAAPPAAPARPSAAPSRGGLFGFLRRTSSAPAPAEASPTDGPPVIDPALVVESKGILDTAIGSLDQLLTGARYDELLLADEAGVVVRDAGEQGPWIFVFRRPFRDALAAVPDHDLGRIGRAWATDEELGASDEEEIAAIVELTGELRDLARTAAATDRDLYLWLSL